MLDKIFGTKTASFILLHLFHYGEIHARGVSRDISISLSTVQKQLEKFEDSGVVVSKKIGNTKIFSFNQKSPLTKPLMELVGVVHSSMSLADKEILFKTRKRPRRAGKPVIGQGEK
ncbi:MAG: winged helix-turn-helix transcriptional regulator [Bacteriovoracaceae bacterium]|nr:winged helix-turn-helix transcriptional regulator [Bacteriovoracaceae bacterium]